MMKKVSLKAITKEKIKFHKKQKAMVLQAIQSQSNLQFISRTTRFQLMLKRSSPLHLPRLLCQLHQMQSYRSRGAFRTCSQTQLGTSATLPLQLCGCCHHCTRLFSGEAKKAADWEGALDGEWE